MRRILLLFTGLGAGFCVFLLLLYGNWNALGAESLPVLAVTAPPSDASTGPAHVGSIPAANITFPYAVPGTPLVIDRMTGYDGPFMEDGSDEEVTNVAALIVRNVGSTGVEQAAVVLERGAMRLVFELSMLPPGAMALVVEKSRQACLPRNFTACTGWAEQSGGGWIWEDAVHIAGVDSLRISLTNVTSQANAGGILYYKTYYQAGKLYLGGKTYCVEFGPLEPGQARILQPEHYVAGYSRIVKIQIYE